VATTLAELAAARERLQWLGGELVLPVLVPPWNRIAPQLLRRLPEAGFVGISGRVSKSAPPPPAVPGLARADIRVDLLDWEQGPRAKPAGAVAAELAAALRDTRAEKGAVGLLTHHLVFDANAWQAFEELVTCITNGAATDWYDWVSLFTRQAPTNGGVVPCTSQGHEPS